MSENRPRFPHLIGKGILYQGESSSKQLTRCTVLVNKLWLLVDKLRKEYDEPSYGAPIIDPRHNIAEDIATLLIECEGTLDGSSTQK